MPVAVPKQGWYQTEVIRAIFGAIGATNRQFVELGFNVNEQCTGSGSNTCGLWRDDGWTGLLLDGDHANASINLHKEMLFSHTIEALFLKYRVPKLVDYVSVDIDSWDIWLVNSLLRSYRPRLISVEYNPNIPWEYALAYPDEPMLRDKSEDRVQHDEVGAFRGGCFYGSSIRALDSLAKAHGYEVVAVTTPLDVFMMPQELAARARRALKRNGANMAHFEISYPRLQSRLASGSSLNSYHEWQRMTPQQAREMVDFDEWKRQRVAGASEAIATTYARRAALNHLAQLGADGRQDCFSQLLGVNESHHTTPHYTTPHHHTTQDDTAWKHSTAQHSTGHITSSRPTQTHTPHHSSTAQHFATPPHHTTPRRTTPRRAALQ